MNHPIPPEMGFYFQLLTIAGLILIGSFVFIFQLNKQHSLFAVISSDGCPWPLVSPFRALALVEWFFHHFLSSSLKSMDSILLFSCWRLFLPIFSSPQLCSGHRQNNLSSHLYLILLLKIRQVFQKVGLVSISQATYSYCRLATR